MQTAFPLAAWQSFPGLAPLMAAANLPAPMRLAAGQRVFSANQVCAGFPLVLEGEVSVSRASDDGRAIELYRITPGEVCLVSCASLFGARPLSADATTVSACALQLVPPSLFHDWLLNAGFRDAVLGQFADRMAELTALVDAISFHRLDERLAAALLGHGPDLQWTHQALALQLGTVREMVTRVLRRFERAGWVALSREHIRIVDSGALRRCAAGQRSDAV